MKMIHERHAMRGCRSTEGAPWFQQEKGIEGASGPGNTLLPLSLETTLIDPALSPELSKPHSCFAKWLPVRLCKQGSHGVPAKLEEEAGSGSCLSGHCPLPLCFLLLSASSPPDSSSSKGFLSSVSPSLTQPASLYSLETQAPVGQCPLLG